MLQTALGDFSVAYQLNAYTREVGRMARTYSELHQHIQDRFAEAGLEILSPTYGAWREGPSTVPDAGALRAARRRLEAAPAADTDGADVPPPPEPAEVPAAKPPPFLRGAAGDGT